MIGAEGGWYWEDTPDWSLTLNHSWHSAADSSLTDILFKVGDSDETCHPTAISNMSLCEYLCVCVYVHEGLNTIKHCTLQVFCCTWQKYMYLYFVLLSHFACGMIHLKSLFVPSHTSNTNNILLVWKMWVYTHACTHNIKHIVVAVIRTCHRKEERKNTTRWITIRWDVSSLIQKKAINQKPLGRSSAELDMLTSVNTNWVMMCFSCWLQAPDCAKCLLKK